MAAHMAFTEEVEPARWHDRRRRGAAAGGHGDVPARHAHRRRDDGRQPVAGPQGDPRRLLPDRGRRRRARPQHRRALPGRSTATSRSARSGTSRRDDGDPAAAAATAHRLYWGRVLSATLRMARDVDIAEEATADAFLLALQTWPERGVPDSVEAWLLTAARRRAIDRIRRLVRFRERVPMLAADATTADGRRRSRRRRRPGRRRRRAAPRRAVLPPGDRPRGPGRADAAPRAAACRRRRSPPPSSCRRRRWRPA